MKFKLFLLTVVCFAIDCRDCQIFASILILIAISAERLLRHVLVWGPLTLVCHMNLIFRAQIWSLFVSEILNLQFRETHAGCSEFCTCWILSIDISDIAGKKALWKHNVYGLAPTIGSAHHLLVLMKLDVDHLGFSCTWDLDAIKSCCKLAADTC